MLFRIIFAILIFTDGKSFELHHILGQGTCLIAEDVVNHAELFIEIRSVDLGLNEFSLFTNSDVVRNIKCLNEVDYFHRDQH